MGAWGEESCSNDSCWDWLGAGGVKDIHDMRQEEVVPCLEEVFMERPEVCRQASECDKLGCVIWFLRAGLGVPKEYLEKALPLTQSLSESAEADGWCDLSERRQQLAQEREEILEALTGNGSIEPKHTPGLLEKIADRLGSAPEPDPDKGEVVELVAGCNEQKVPTMYVVQCMGADGNPKEMTPVDHRIWLSILDKLGAHAGEIIRVRLSKV